MIRSKILYLFLLIGVAFSAIIYSDYYTIMLFVLTLILPIILYIIIVIIKGSIVVDIKSLNSIGNKDEKISFEVILENKSIFPISNCELRLSYHNNFKDNIEKEYIVIPAAGKSTERLTCSIISRHCGNVMINLDRIKIYDYFKLFSTRKKVNCNTTLSILPKIHELDILMNSNEGEIAVDSEIFSKIKSGDDPSEVFDIREYMAGDRIQRIHWKLSTKQQELMVKEFSLPLSSDGIILLELFSDKKSLIELDSLIETTISLSYFLLSYDYFHYISWYDQSKGEINKNKITSRDDLFETLNLIMLTKPYYDSTYTLKYHNSSSKNEKYSHIFYITSKLSKELNIELQGLGEKLTLLHINNSEDIIENEEINNLVAMGIGVLPIKTENIKESIDKLVIY